MSHLTVLHLPSELLSSIACQVYTSGLPPSSVSLDPFLVSDDVYAAARPTALSGCTTAGSWTEPCARKTLASLCLVSHAFADAAKPWLWRSVQVRLPRSWLSLLDQLIEEAECEDEHEASLARSVLGRTCVAVTEASDASAGEGSQGRPAPDALLAWDAPDVSVPPELLSPAASRDPSPRRLRSKSKSPPRWKLIRSLTDAMENMLASDTPFSYNLTPQDSSPGRFITRLDFNHFRTIGMRRSMEEGVNSRFVTGDRLEAVLKEMPYLRVFGATEYMDGALTLPVLKELLLRGSPSGGRGRALRNDFDAEEDRERLREFRELDAIDFTGCVSSVFVHALTEFVGLHLLSSGSEADRRQGRSEQLTFPGLRRLGLRGVKSIPASVLNAFILACPSLTHLDVSCTRITPDLLEGLCLSTSVRLHSLSLERCAPLTSESIASFLITSPAASTIKELNLYGDGKYPTPITEGDLRSILSKAPCFTSGELVYLDLSSAPLTPSLLGDVFPPQPALRSLGLAHIPTLPLGALRDFVSMKAPHVEVLSMACTSPELGYAPLSVNGVERRTTPAAAVMAVHTQLVGPLCTAPFSFSWRAEAKAQEPPTRVRVIELATGLLAGLHAGAGAWKVVRSKGGRAWYVDTACGWVVRPGEAADKSVLRRELEEGHALRTELERLAQANGNVSSGVGWHARKMEVLDGCGMLGREEGLYGAVSFAYQG